MSPLVSMRLNAVGLLAISAILLAAFADQIFNPARRLRRSDLQS